MESIKAGELRGIARPSARLGALLGKMRTPAHVIRMMEDIDAAAALAKMLEVGFEPAVTADGRVDFLKLAAGVIGKMREGQR